MQTFRTASSDVDDPMTVAVSGTIVSAGITVVLQSGAWVY